MVTTRSGSAAPPPEKGDSGKDGPGQDQQQAAMTLIYRSNMCKPNLRSILYTQIAHLRIQRHTQRHRW